MKINTQVKNQRLIDEKHRRIVNVASSLFIKKGFHQTTIREIADASQMSMGLLYKYISSKDDVLSLVYRELSDQFFISLSKANTQRRSIGPVEKLRGSIKGLLRLVQNDRKKFLFLYTESKYLNSSALKEVLSMESRVIDAFKNIIEEGVQKELFDVKEPLLAASIIVYLLMIEPLRGWSYRKEYTPGHVHEYLVNFCLNAIEEKKRF